MSLLRSGMAVAAVAIMTLSACSSASPAPDSSSGTAAGPAEVVTTITPLGSIVGQIADCAGLSSSTLMAPGQDPHTFALSSAELTELAKAKLVISNGLGLEGGLQKTLDAIKQDDTTVMEVAPLLDPMPLDGNTDNALDPHVWLDAKRMAQAASLIGDELSKATGDAKARECGLSVQKSLTELDSEMRTTLDTIPKDRRVLITDHDAFGYFAKAYGFDVAGVVVPGGSTDAQPSSADIATLVETIKRVGVSTIFSNTAVSQQIIDAVAAEAGSKVKVVELYVGTVGPDRSGADTYQTMMLTDAKRIAGGLA